MAQAQGVLSMSIWVRSPGPQNYSSSNFHSKAFSFILKCLLSQRTTKMFSDLEQGGSREGQAEEDEEDQSQPKLRSECKVS